VLAGKSGVWASPFQAIKNSINRNKLLIFLNKVLKYTYPKDVEVSEKSNGFWPVSFLICS